MNDIEAAEACNDSYGAGLQGETPLQLLEKCDPVFSCFRIPQRRQQHHGDHGHPAYPQNYPDYVQRARQCDVMHFFHGVQSTLRLRRLIDADQARNAGSA
jgi:hypothetical protein